MNILIKNVELLKKYTDIWIKGVQYDFVICRAL